MAESDLIILYVHSGYIVMLALSQLSSSGVEAVLSFVSEHLLKNPVEGEHFIICCKVTYVLLMHTRQVRQCCYFSVFEERHDIM